MNSVSRVLKLLGMVWSRQLSAKGVVVAVAATTECASPEGTLCVIVRCCVVQISQAS